MIAAKCPQTTAANPTAPLLRKLEGIHPLSSAAKDAVSRLPMTIRHYAKHELILADGDKPTTVYLVVDGCVFRYAVLPDGKRQIMSLHVAGDMLNLQNLFLNEIDHSIAALIPTAIGLIPRQAMRSLLEDQPEIAMRLWHETFIDSATSRQWLIGIGRRNAYARVAHLMCEFFARMTAAGLCEGGTCDFPLTQAELGDALGLSLVHINRTIKKLHHDGLITARPHLLTIHDWTGLKDAADFDSAYLELVGPVVLRK
jgi:CRP-like cAMP-binding protein